MASRQKVFARKPENLSNEDKIRRIEELLRLNKGGFSATGFDVDSTFTPTRVSDKAVGNPFGIAQSRGFQPDQTTLPGGQDYNPDIPPGIDLPPEDETAVGVRLPSQAASNFLNRFTQSVVGSNDQQEQVYQATGIPYEVANTNDGGVMTNERMVLYPDGTIREPSGQTRQANERDFITQTNFLDIGRGLAGLVQGIFNQGRTITQKYGVYNPIEPTPGNINVGTDIRTRDLAGEQRNLRLPVNAEVVQVYQDDGTRFGQQSGHQGYGNSVLIRLDSGEMLRFSHLNNPVQFAPGDTIPAGVSFGQPGTTGNTYGEHLDLEVYNPQGEIIDPEQFSGFGNQSTFTANPDFYVNVAQQENIPLKSARPSPTLPEGLQSLLGEKQAQQQGRGESRGEVLSSEQNANLNNLVIKPEWQGTEIRENPTLGTRARRTAADIINEVNPTGQFDLGATELLQGNPNAAAAAIEKTQPTGAGIDFGISESLRGDVKGASEVRQATAQNVQRKAGEVLGNVGDTAGKVVDFTRNFIENLNYNQIPQAGEGIKNQYVAPQLAKTSLRPEPNQIGQQFGLQIGDSPTSSLAVAEGRASRQSEGQADTRDPFFKEGGLGQRFSQFLQPNADQLAGGALTPGVLSSQFYERREAQPDIESIFEGTAAEGEAQGRFEDYRNTENRRAAEQFRQKYAGGNYNQADVERLYNEMLGGNYADERGFVSGGLAPEPKKAVQSRPSLADYLAQGKTVAQYYAETGQQSTLDKLGGSQPKAIEQARYNEAYASPSTVAQAQRYGAQGDGGVTSIKYPSGQTVVSAPGTVLRADSEGQVQQIGINDVPEKTRSAQLAYQPPIKKEEDSLLNRAYTNVQNLFKRVF